MFYTSEEWGIRPEGFAEERVILGKCHNRIYSRAPVVGRLMLGKDLKSFYGKEALLAVVCDGTDRDSIEDSRTVGVVRIADGEENISSVPLPSITVKELPHECNGRIALLDPTSERIFISPDITTVNKYLPMIFKKPKESVPPFVLREGKVIRISVIRGAEDTCFDCDTLLLPCQKSECEEELYLRYAEMAEGAIGRSLIVSLSARPLCASSLRALMRGAVWGELSLLICGILTEGELTEFTQEFCRAFCELETEGREFNGYLRRGLCVDTPYLLSIVEKLKGIDFFIFDLEKIVFFLCGGRETPPADVILYALESVCAAINSRGDIRHGVILGKKTLTTQICERLTACGVSRFAVAPEHISTLYRLL